MRRFVAMTCEDIRRYEDVRRRTKTWCVVTVRRRATTCLARAGIDRKLVRISVLGIDLVIGRARVALDRKLLRNDVLSMDLVASHARAVLDSKLVGFRFSV